MNAALHPPLRLQPVYKQYVWGGDRLIRDYHRPLPPGMYAESWEIADHPDGQTRLLNGPDSGATLAEAMARNGPEWLGTGAGETAFPLAVKIIDARESLSVQVHPNEAAAARGGGEPKSELWYVLAAAPEARIYSGFKPGVTARDFEQARARGGLASLFQCFTALPGMVFHTPGGRVHAIGAGCLLLEVQQNSNTTYRLFDWNRTGNAGAARPLHVGQALQVIDWSQNGSPLPPVPPAVKQPAGHAVRAWIDSPHFRFEEWLLPGPCAPAPDPAGFSIFFAVDSDLAVHAPPHPPVKFPRGSTCLLPAGVASYSIEPLRQGPGSDRVLVIRRPTARLPAAGSRRAGIS